MNEKLLPLQCDSTVSSMAEKPLGIIWSKALFLQIKKMKPQGPKRELQSPTAS